MNLNKKPAQPKHSPAFGFALVSLVLMGVAVTFGGFLWVLRNDFVTAARKVSVRPLTGEERELFVAHLDRLRTELPKHTAEIERVRTSLYVEKTAFLITPAYLQHHTIEKRDGRWIISETFFGSDSRSQELAVLRALGIRSETALRPRSGIPHAE